MKFLKEPSTYVLSYIAVLIFTFGHAYNAYPLTYEEQFRDKVYTIRYDPLQKGIGSLFSSLLWPLYWSVEVQK
jgi:hypothetical protein